MRILIVRMLAAHSSGRHARLFCADFDCRLVANCFRWLLGNKTLYDALSLRSPFCKQTRAF